MQLSHSISGEPFVSPSMEAFYKVRCKESEIVPEWAGLMTAKSKDPLDKAELRALNMRRSKKHELVSKKRELFGNKTPKERSVSPMFGEATQANAGVGSPYEIDAAA
jgi:hypothetical protein